MMAHGFGEEARCLSYLNDLREAHRVELGEDLLFRDLLGELPEKDGGQEDDPVLEIEYLVEVVLFHVDRVPGAGFKTHTTVDTSIFVYGSQTIPYAYRLRGAQAHAMRATDTSGRGYF